MDYFVTLRIPFNVHCILNACRLYLLVVTVSDICSADGKYILPEIKAGNPIMHRHSNLAWPIQDRPQPADWRIWRHHLAYLEDKGQLITPLGRWTAKSHQQWHSYYNSEMKILYVKDADGNTNIFHPVIRPNARITRAAIRPIYDLLKPQRWMDPENLQALPATIQLETHSQPYVDVDHSPNRHPEASPPEPQHHPVFIHHI
jgi:hypothetical protein